MHVALITLALKSNSLDSLDGKPPGLTVVLLNDRSVKGKAANIHDLIPDEYANLACITEIWWNEAGEFAFLNSVHLDSLCCYSRPDLGGGLLQ